jgi:FkbM family methyltransferase
MIDAPGLADLAPLDLERLLEASRPGPLARPARGYWIYGAGGFGRQLACELVRLGQPVLGFIDRRGRELSDVDGLSCRHPEEFTGEDARGAHYVHGILNHAIDPHDVLAWAESRAFDALVFPASFYELPGFAVERYWFASPEETLAHLRELESIHAALEDQESRTTLVELLRYRLSSDPRLHPAVREEEVYVERFLPIFDRPMTFVDAGAFTGDSLEALLNVGVDVREWLAFEPDPDNAREARRTAAKHSSRLTSFTLVPSGLANVNARLSFAASAGTSSRLLGPGEAGGTVEVEVLRLDDAFRRSGPIYVKMDIEGAEQDALRGMRNLLAEQQPVLAISAYHRPADLWEIPRLVRELYPDPRLWLRQHCHHGFETVLYVAPR